MKNYFWNALLIFTVLFFISCDDDDGPVTSAPEISSTTTEQNAEITYTSIEISGDVTSDGGSDVTSRGVCWSINQNPTTSDNITTETSNEFTSLVEGLTANTTYHFRVYATNSTGTSYGNPITLNTSSLDGTTWDFTISLDNTTPNYTWNADIIFNPDGTTVYDEPSSPGTYTTYGVWSLNGNTLEYNMDSSTSNGVYEFTGTLNGNTMSGTFLFPGYSNPVWSAVEY